MTSRGSGCIAGTGRSSPEWVAGWCPSRVGGAGWSGRDSAGTCSRIRHRSVSAAAVSAESGWWRAAAVLGIAERVLVEAKTGGRDWAAALLVGLSPLAALPVVGQVPAVPPGVEGPLVYGERADRMTAASTDWPAPGYRGVLGHVPRWGSDSLGLLEEGARLGPVFSMRLWRKAMVGYRPDWNRLVLGDLDGFRSRGSLSQLSPVPVGRGGGPGRAGASGAARRTEPRLSPPGGHRPVRRPVRCPCRVQHFRPVSSTRSAGHRRWSGG